MIKRKVGAKTGSGAQMARRDLALPTQKTQLPTDMSEYTAFIYGHQKIGKTSLTAEFPEALHFFFEPSGKDYELYAVEPETWADFKGYIELLKKAKAEGELQFKTFVLDVVDLAYEKCLLHICGLQGLTYPPMNDFGRTWREIKDEFRNTMIDLARLGGIVCVSHAKEVDIETRGGAKYTVVQPSAPKGCVEVLSKWADLTGYYRSSEDGGRELCITPTPEYEAGNRMESRFKYKDGSQIKAIPMGDSSKEAYENFLSAFRNELEAPKDDGEASEPTKNRLNLSKKKGN